MQSYTARHEAAHALVASVLGLPLKEATVHRHSLANVLGTTTLGPITAIPTMASLYKLIVFKIATNLAGNAWIPSNQSPDAVLCELADHPDLIESIQLAWIGHPLHREGWLPYDILKVLIPALHAPAWQEAIEAGAAALLQELGRPVPAAVFATIARNYDLTLPEVMALARCPSGSVEEMHITLAN